MKQHTKDLGESIRAESGWIAAGHVEVAFNNEGDVRIQDQTGAVFLTTDQAYRLARWIMKHATRARE